MKTVKYGSKWIRPLFEAGYGDALKRLRDMGIDAAEMVVGCYWFAHDWYDGDADPLYRAMCQSPYRPSCLCAGIGDEDGDSEVAVYNELLYNTHA